MTTRLLAATAALVVLGAAPAAAEQGRRADFSLTTSATAPGAPTGLAFHAAFHQAGDPAAKPPPLRTAVIHLPAGLRFDSTAVPQCTASDEELHLLGSDACPHESELTVGALSAVTGFGPPVDPLMGDDHVFNGPNQIIEVITAPGTSASPGFDRLTIQGSTITAHPPMTPGGPPDGETAIRSIDFTFGVRGDGARTLVTTPADCPASGQWTTSGTFGFADGTSETVVSATPCAAAAAPSSAAAAPKPRRHRPRHRSRARRHAGRGRHR